MSNDAAWLKQLTRLLIGDARGSRSVVAKLLGVTNPEVTYWCEPQHNRFIPVDHLYELDAQRGDIFLKAWAERRGYELTPVEKVSPKIGEIISIAAEIALSAGEAVHEMVEDGKDHDYSASDARRIRDCLGKLSSEINAANEALP